MDYYKSVLLILFFIAVILAIGSFLATPTEKVKMGILTTRKTKFCEGTLTLNSKEKNGKCEIQADVVLSNCEGTKWFLFIGEKCSGTYICGNRDVMETPSRWRCTWEYDKGTYTFSLCANDKLLTKQTITC